MSEENRCRERKMTILEKWKRVWRHYIAWTNLFSCVSFPLGMGFLLPRSKLTKRQIELFRVVCCRLRNWRVWLCPSITTRRLWTRSSTPSRCRSGNCSGQRAKRRKKEKQRQPRFGCCFVLLWCSFSKNSCARWASVLCIWKERAEPCLMDSHWNLLETVDIAA